MSKEEEKGEKRKNEDEKLLYFVTFFMTPLKRMKIYPKKR
jgi:hypothetical protein